MSSFCYLQQMAAAATTVTCLPATTLSSVSRNPFTVLDLLLPKFSTFIHIAKPTSISFLSNTYSDFSSVIHSHKRTCKFLCRNSYATPVNTRSYEFLDSSSDLELRLQLGGLDIQNSREVSVDVNDTSLTVRVQRPGSAITLIETDKLFDKIKPGETIWYLDDDELVVNLKKHDPDLKWPDILESWESLSAGSAQLLKGASIYLVGNSTDINQKVARELATGLGYTPLSTQELLETLSKRTIDSWVLAEGFDSVAEAEGSVLESLSSHVRAVVATLGGQTGVAIRPDKWRHLYAGFTVWLSQTEALDEGSAKEEAHKHMKDTQLGYTSADVVIKLQGWDSNHAKAVAQASLSGLKQLIMSDKKLPGKKSLYIRLGCRGDWPNIEPPGWDPSAKGTTTSS